jgi:hypothetical protein
MEKADLVLVAAIVSSFGIDILVATKYFPVDVAYSISSEW